MCVSLDIDRFTDRELKKRWCPSITHTEGPKKGKHVTPTELRNEIARLRAKGLEVFPPCDNTDALGHCKGHELLEGAVTESSVSGTVDLGNMIDVIEVRAVELVCTVERKL